MEHVEEALWKDDKFIGNISHVCIREGSHKFSKLLRQRAQQLRDKMSLRDCNNVLVFQQHMTGNDEQETY